MAHTLEAEISTGIAKLEYDNNNSVTLFVNGVPSSYLDLNDPKFLAFEYMQQMNVVVANLRPGPIRALHLGAGACALAWAWALENPKSRQIAVDIDAKLVELVRVWFDLPRAPALRIRAQDACEAIQQARPETFDVIVRDVFAGDSTPKNLISSEFTEATKRALKPNGIYLANCADRPPLNGARNEIATLIEHFGDDQVAVIAEKGILNGKRYGNLVLVARKENLDNNEAKPLDNPALARALRSLPVPADILAYDDLQRFISRRR